METLENDEGELPNSGFGTPNQKQAGTSQPRPESSRPGDRTHSEPSTSVEVDWDVISHGTRTSRILESERPRSAHLDSVLGPNRDVSRDEEAW